MQRLMVSQGVVVHAKKYYLHQLSWLAITVLFYFFNLEQLREASPVPSWVVWKYLMTYRYILLIKLI